MSSIEDIAVDIYKRNLDYLREEQIDLYNKLKIFEEAIEQNLYDEKYELRFDEDENYFDVYIKESDTFLYGTNSYEDGLKRAQSINFDANINSFRTYYSYNYKNEKSVDILDGMDFRRTELSCVAKIENYINKNSPKSEVLDKIYKFIFFGVGLGQHIAYTHEKIQAVSYFFVESDLELFKLSLFTTKYYELAKRAKLFFAIAANDIEFNKTCQLFLNFEWLVNSYLKFYLLNDNNKIYFNSVRSLLSVQSHYVYPYNLIYERTFSPIPFWEKKFNFLNISHTHSNNIFMEKPVIFLAAGPSLTKNIDWLKENKDKFIIATAAINLSILEKYDIFPNMIFSIDGGKNTLNEYVFDKLENKEYKDKIYKESIFILSSVTDIDSLKNISKDNIFIYQVKTKYNKNLSAISGFSIGETAYGLLLIMGVKKLFLLGLDLAIDSDTGKTHSENTLSASSFDIDVDGNSLENSQNSSVYESVVSVKGNLREKVHSTILFNQSRIVLNLGTNLYKQDFQEVYNLSDGAYFENTKPLQKDNILDVIDLKNISTKQEEIKEEFLKESENTLPKDDLEYLHKCYEEIENIETKIKNFAKIKGFSNKGSYLDVLYDFLLDLIYKNEKEFSYFPLYDLYKDYFKFIIPRIFTFFSIKDVKNHKRHTKKIHSYLIKQLFKINDKYKCDMREFLDSL